MSSEAAIALVVLAAIATAPGSQPDPLTPILNIRPAAIRDAALSPDGRLVAIAASNLTLWDARTGTFLRPILDRPCVAVRFVNQHRLFAMGVDWAAVIDVQGPPKLKDLPFGRADPTYLSHFSIHPAVSPDGQWVAAGWTHGAIMEPSGSLTYVSFLKLWQLSTGRLVAEARPQMWLRKASLAISPDGRFLAIVADTQTAADAEKKLAVHLFTIPDLRHKKSIPLPWPGRQWTPLLFTSAKYASENMIVLTCLLQPGVVIADIDLTTGRVRPWPSLPDSRRVQRAWLVSSDSALLSYSDGARIARKDGVVQYFPSQLRSISRLCSVQGTSATVLVPGGHLLVLNLRTARVATTVGAVPHCPVLIEWSQPDGLFCAYLPPRCAALWSLRTPGLSRTLDLDYDFLTLSASAAGRSAKAAMLSTRGQLLTLPGHRLLSTLELPDLPSSAAIGRLNTGLLAAASLGCKVRVYGRQSKRPLATFSPHHPSAEAEFVFPGPLLLVPDERLVCFGCDWNQGGVASGLAVANGWRMLWVAAESKVEGLGLDKASGQLFFVGSSYVGAVRRDGQLAWTLDTPDGVRHVIAAAFLPRQKAFVIAAEDSHALWLFDIATRSFHRLATVPGLSEDPTYSHLAWPAVAVDPAEKRVALADWAGGCVTIYSLPDGRLLGQLFLVADFLAKPPSALLLTPQGYYAGSSDAARFVSWRVGHRLYPVGSFAARCYRPDLVARALAGHRVEPISVSQALHAPPSVQIIAPRDGQTIAPDADQLRLEIVVTASGRIARVEVYVNGRRVSVEVERGIALSAKGIALSAKDMPEGHNRAIRFAGVVPLPADQALCLSVSACDVAGYRSPPARVWLYRSAAQAARGKLYVLAVGVSKYRNSRYNLRYAAGDAAAVAEALRTQAPHPYSQVVCKLLVDEQATANALRDALASLRHSAGTDDTVVLFLSGHGLRAPDGHYLFATHDTDLTRPHESTLPWSELRDALRLIKARQIVVLIDTCHSGAALGSRLVGTHWLAEQLAIGTGALVFAASSAGEASLESDQWGHGAFAKAILDLLHGSLGVQGPIGPVDLMYHVCRRVRELTNGMQRPTIPLLTNFPTDLTIFAASAHPAGSGRANPTIGSTQAS